MCGVITQVEVIFTLWYVGKIHVPVRQKRHITYRKYKGFVEEHYISDLERIPFHVSEICEDIDDSYWFCEQLLKEIIDDHAPIKTKIVKNNQVPYMNNILRKAINVRNVLAQV